MKSLISNPPYNLKWKAPVFAQIQPRFAEYGVPPDNNANFAFILTGLDMVDGKAAFLLPCSVLDSSTAQEQEIRRTLIEKNLIEAVIILPDRMFEATSITTCIFLINKSKQSLKVEFIDMRQEYTEEQRDQNGQFGGASHEKRTYHKTVKVLTDEAMTKALDAIEKQENTPGFCKAATPEEIKANDFNLTPARYIDSQQQEYTHRNYEDIAIDYNRIIREKNSVKITINESLAKSLGLYDLALKVKQGCNIDLQQSFELVGQMVEKDNYLTLSKNAAEFRIENKAKDKLPEMLLMFLQMWKQHIMYLNNEENRILAEMRDALLNDLMTGKIEVV